VFALRYEKRELDRAVPYSLGLRPLFERGGIVDGESLQEVAPQSPFGRRGRCALQCEDVYLELLRIEPDEIAGRIEPIGAQTMAQAADRLIEGVARVVLVLVRPEDAGQMPAGTGVLGRQC
jgi:hypothetical protein